MILFRSRACAPLILLETHAHYALSLWGKHLQAPPQRGILTLEQLAQAIAQLQAAIDQAAAQDTQVATEEEPQESAVGLRQRYWPLLQLLQKSLAAGEAVTWGV